MIDSTTWCAPENKAGKYLADELYKINDSNLTQKVSVYFHRFQNRMKAINGLEKDMRCFYLDLLVMKTKKEINTHIYQKKVRTLMNNVITSFYRIELNKILYDNSEVR